jgi:mercuric ion transport protein
MHLPGVTINEETKSDCSGNAQALLAAAGLLGAVAASSCCILPLVMFALGASGAWISYFTQLAPFQPFFLAAAFVSLGAGTWLVRRTSTKVCAEGSACAQRLPHRLITAALITAALLVVAAIGFDFLGPLLLS